MTTGGQVGFTCYISYGNANESMSYQSYLTRIEGERDVPRICEHFTTNILDTITGSIDGIGRGASVYSVACGHPYDFNKQLDWTYISSARDYNLTSNLAGQTNRRARAAVDLNVRRSRDG